MMAPTLSPNPGPGLAGKGNASSPYRDGLPELVVGRKYSVIAMPVLPWRRHEVRQTGLTRQCETLIRSYDPCISCATHFLNLTIEGDGDRARRS